MKLKIMLEGNEVRNGVAAVVDVVNMTTGNVTIPFSGIATGIDAMAHDKVLVDEAKCKVLWTAATKTLSLDVPSKTMVKLITFAVKFYGIVSPVFRAIVALAPNFEKQVNDAYKDVFGDTYNRKRTVNEIFDKDVK